jgi:hypothetical protein
MKRIHKKIRIKRGITSRELKAVEKKEKPMSFPELLSRTKDALSPRVRNYWLPWFLANAKEKDKLREQGRTPWL